MKRTVFLILLSFALTNTYSQVMLQDSTARHKIFYTSFDPFVLDTIFVDTTLRNMDYHYPNSVFNSNASLSNFGSSFYSLSFDDYSNEFLKLHNNQIILKSEETFTRYNGDTLYANLFYAAGPNKNKRLNLDFGHILLDNWSYHLKVRYIDGKEAFVGDAKDVRNFNFNTSYTLPSKIYSIDFGYLHRKIRSNENGGVDTTSYFVDDYNPIEYRTNFSNSNYFYKEDTYLLNHRLSLAPIVQKYRKDSICDMGSLVFRNEFRMQKRVYEDMDTVYFPEFQNANGSFDSTAMYRDRHSIAWEKTDFILSRLNTSVGIQNEDIRISDSIFKYNYNSTNLIIKAIYSWKDVWLLSAYSKTTFAGSFMGDFLQKVKLNYKGKKFLANYRIKLTNALPRFLFLHQNTNHYSWNTNFSKERSLSQSVNLRFKGISFGIRMNSITNYSYLSQNYLFSSNENTFFKRISPKQYSSILTHLKLKFALQIPLRFIHFKVEGIYQKVSNDTVLPLPEWIVKSSISYTHELFHAATLTIGTDAMMHAKYYARAFNPALQAFYLQNNTEVGEYLYLNAFVKLKLKRVNMYVDYSNIGAYFLPKEYYEVPEYPLHPPGVYYGVSWRFYN